MKITKREIILFISLFLIISNLFSQTITFKKVYPSISGVNYKEVVCKTLFNDKSFLISSFAGGNSLFLTKKHLW